MNYEVTWSERSVRVDYHGDVDNETIEEVHYALNSDDRFYRCKTLILDCSHCSLAQVDVASLFSVVATDLGATRTLPKLKVAMIACDPVNIARTSEYIQWSNKVSPWVYHRFDSIEEAQGWMNE